MACSNKPDSVIRHTLAIDASRQKLADTDFQMKRRAKRSIYASNVVLCFSLSNGGGTPPALQSGRSREELLGRKCTRSARSDVEQVYLKPAVI